MPAYVEPKSPRPGLPGEAPQLPKSVSMTRVAMRYFHCSYQARGGFMGDLPFNCPGHPSASAIRAHIATIAQGTFRADDVVILFLSEFKSRDDYEAFKK